MNQGSIAKRLSILQLGKRSTPLRNGIRLDKMKVSKDEQAFLIDLHKYMKSRNTPIGRIPSLGFKQSKSSSKRRLVLHPLYKLTKKICLVSSPEPKARR